MASSGSFTGSIRDGHYTLKVSWSQTKDVANNQSTVKATMYLINDWTLYISGRSDNTCTINGSSGTYSSPAINSTGTHTLGSVSKTVNHNNDGTKSLTISAVFYIRATLSGTYYEKITASATITLDSIPRASTVSASNVNLNSATTISITRAASSFTHTLSYSFGSQTGTIATKTDKTSVSWTPPLSLASQIPKAVSGTCTITCDTYSGSTKVGSKTCTLTLTVPSSVKPTITSLTATRVDGAVPSTWGIYVQSKSKATLTINGAAGTYGSTITSYSISGGGFSSTESSFTTGFLNTSGTITFTAKVTDSRGRTSTDATVSISVVAYAPPSFTSYLSQRSTSDGTVKDDGTYIRGLVSYSYSSCSSKNTVTRATEYKKSSVSSWTNANKSFSSGTAIIFGGGGISTESSYDVRYTITDAFTSITVTDTVSTASVLMDFKAGGKGLAIGKVSERDNTVEIAESWDLMVYGKKLMELIYPVGSIYMSVNSTNPGSLFGGTWVAWGAGRVPVGINTGDSSFNTVEKTGGAKSVTLTEAQLPHITGQFQSRQVDDMNVLDVFNGGGCFTYTQNGGAQWKGQIDGHKTSTTKNALITLDIGSGQSHSNLQPYITCYMWKRTA